MKGVAFKSDRARPHTVAGGNPAQKGEKYFTDSESWSVRSKPSPPPAAPRPHPCG